MMSDELNVIDEDKGGRAIMKNKLYVTAGAVGACVVVLMLLSVVSIGARRGSDDPFAAGGQLNVRGTCKYANKDKLSQSFRLSLCFLRVLRCGRGLLKRRGTLKQTNLKSGEITVRRNVR